MATAHSTADHPHKSSDEDAPRPVHPTAKDERIYTTFEERQQHAKEVKADEEARTKAFADSPAGKRIESRQKADTKSTKEGDSKAILTEEDAIARSTTPPEVNEQGEVQNLPKGAVLPPASREPYYPMARAYDTPLMEPAQ